MLKRKFVVYKDGRKEDTIFHVEKDSPTIIYPKRDNIRHCAVAPFKYRIRLKPGEILAIVKLNNKTILMPRGFEVHPKTTLEDVIVTKIQKKKKKKQESNTHTFKSSSSDSVYTVRETLGTFKCNCPGFYRSKDRKCKHIKLLESKNQ